MHNFYYPPGLEHSGEFTYIGSGMNSDVYRRDDRVFKISRRTRSASGAHQAMRRQFDEYDQTAHYLGNTVVPTLYHVMEHGVKMGRFVVITTQPYIEGLSIADTGDDVDTDALARLYEDALRMYEDTGKIPDLACIEHGLFDARQSPNVKITPDGQPVLIDPNGGKLQSSRLFGPLWNFWISEGVTRALWEL